MSRRRNVGNWAGGPLGLVETEPDGFEEAWIQSFNAGRLQTDFGTLTIAFIVVLGSIAKFPDKFYPKLVIDSASLFIIFGVVQQLLFFFLLCAARSSSAWHNFYLRSRSRIIVIHLLVRTVSYYLMVIRYPTIFERVQPTEFPSSPGRLAARFFYIPILVAYHTSGYILPIAYFRVISYFSLFQGFISSFARCQQEIALVPGLGGRYHALAFTVEENIFKWIPFPVAPVTASDLENLDKIGPVGTCFAVNSTLLVVIGHLLPMAVVVAEEIISRKSFERKYHLSTAFHHGPWWLVILHLCLIPFQAAILYSTLLLAMHWIL